METQRWWKVKPVWFEIKPVEVISSTAKTVTLRNNGHPRREAKITALSEYYPTWSEAHARLMEIADLNLRRARVALETAQSKYRHAKGLREPTDG